MRMDLRIQRPRHHHKHRPHRCLDHPAHIRSIHQRCSDFLCMMVRPNHTNHLRNNMSHRCPLQGHCNCRPIGSYIPEPHLHRRCRRRRCQHRAIRDCIRSFRRNTLQARNPSLRHTGPLGRGNSHHFPLLNHRSCKPLDPCNPQHFGNHHSCLHSLERLLLRSHSMRS